MHINKKKRFWQMAKIVQDSSLHNKYNKRKRNNNYYHHKRSTVQSQTGSLWWPPSGSPSIGNIPFSWSTRILRRNSLNTDHAFNRTYNILKKFNKKLLWQIIKAENSRIVCIDICPTRTIRSGLHYRRLPIKNTQITTIHVTILPSLFVRIEIWINGYVVGLNFTETTTK